MVDIIILPQAQQNVSIRECWTADLKSLAGFFLISFSKCDYWNSSYITFRFAICLYKANQLISLITDGNQHKAEHGKT